MTEIERNDEACGKIFTFMKCTQKVHEGSLYCFCASVLFTSLKLL